MAGVIDSKDFVPELNKIEKALIKTANAMAKNAKILKELNEQLNRGAATQEKVTGAKKEEENATKKLNAEEKKLQQIKKQSEAMTKKVIFAQEKEKQRVKELREEYKKMQGESGKSQSFTQKLSKSFQTAQLALFGYIAAVIAVVKGLKTFIDSSIKANKELSKVKTTFQTSEEDARRLTIAVRQLSAAFDKDFNDVLKSANILTKEFGITGDEALYLIEKGFEKGADVNGEFLQLLKEYPSQLRTVGLNASQTIALITQTEREGVFSDKGIDAIKEAGISLREMTPATKTALNAIGISGNEIQNQLKEGSITLFDVMKKVSAKLSELPPQSKEVGQAIADIFKGAGEDAGIRFLTTLKDVNLELNNIGDSLSENEKASKRLSDEWVKFSESVNKTGGFFDKLSTLSKKGLAEFIKRGRIFLSEQDYYEDLVNSKVPEKVQEITDKFNNQISVIQDRNEIIKKAEEKQGELLKENEKLISKAIVLQSAINTAKRSDLYDYKEKKAILDIDIKANEEAVKRLGLIIENTNKEISQQKAINESKRIVAANMRKLDKEAIAFEQAQIDEELAMNENYLEDLQKQQNDAYNVALEELAKHQDNINKMILKNEKELADSKRKREEKEKEERLKAEEDELNIRLQTANELFNFTSTLRDRDIQQLEENARKGIITEEQAAKRIARIKEKQAIADKAQGIFNAVINTATAISKVLATPFLIPAIAALGAVQIATITAQPIPKFAEGTNAPLMNDTLSIVGDGGKHEVIKTKDGKLMITPNTDTLINLPKGAEVFKDVETAIQQLGGIDDSHLQKLILSNQEIKQAIINNNRDNWNVTEGGWRYTHKKNNSSINRIDKYFRY